jgi:DUF1680 family protein
MKLADPTHCTLAGEEAARLSLAIEHLQRLNAEEMWRELENPDTIWHWSADYPGRWIATMALLTNHTGVDYGAHGVARRLIGYQRPDGSYGDFTSPHGYKEWFGMGRGLVGLLEYYQATDDVQALDSAKRLGEYYLTHYPRMTPYMYECYPNALEGIVLLARLTGEQRFLDFAHEMAETSMIYQQVWFSTELGENGRRSPCGGQVHCQLMAARGLLDLAELSGATKYIAPVLALQQHICDKVLSVAGGVGIYFNRPEENEACADADWLRLNLQLWRMTGEPQYLALAENTLLNQIPFSQAANGAYCYLRGVQGRSGNSFDVCCSHHAPRAVWEALRYAVTTTGGRVDVNLHLEGTFTATPNEQPFVFRAEKGHEEGTLVWRYTIEEAPGDAIDFRIRIPGWANSCSASLNDNALAVGGEASHAGEQRIWNPGDVLEIRLSYRPTFIHGYTIGRQVIYPGEAALLVGPRVFTLSDSSNPAIDINTARIHADADGNPICEEVARDRVVVSGENADGTPTSLVLTPLTATGGNPNGIGRSHPILVPAFRTWITVREVANAG